MQVELNENNTKNLIYISYEDILKMVENLYKKDFYNLDADNFLFSLKKNYKGDISEYECRELIDKTYLLRNIQKEINSFLEWLLLEYATKKWIDNFMIWNRHIRVVKKIKERQNLVDMLISTNSNKDLIPLEEINISVDKFYKKLNDNNFPIEIANQILKEQGFIYLEKEKNIYYKYTKKINWIDYNIDFKFIFIDLKEALKKQYNSYIIWLVKLNEYLSDISKVYNYAKWKIKRICNDDDLLTLNFDSWKYYLKEVEKEKIKLFNDNWYCFYNFIVDNNILNSNDLIDVIWSRNKTLWLNNLIYEYENKIEIK